MGINQTKGKLKCHRCEVCSGYGCIGELPGLGGVFESKNFQLNCDSWRLLKEKALCENSEKTYQSKLKELKSKYSKFSKLAEASSRINLIAFDIYDHFVNYCLPNQALALKKSVQFMLYVSMFIT